MFRISDENGQIRTISLREWLVAGRAKRREWRGLRREAKVAARASSAARAAARAAESKMHGDQAKGLSGGM
jgi:hypothetical protein